MANLNEKLPLMPEEKRLFKHPMPNKPSSKGCMLSFMLVGFSVFSLFFVACEGSKTDRMIKATERAVDDYNNGDSSSLIMLIVGALVLGALWLLGKWIDSKK